MLKNTVQKWENVTSDSVESILYIQETYYTITMF